MRLAGGNMGGAVLVDGTVRRTPGPWTPAVHALLGYLERQRFPGAPRALGVDDEGREELSFLPGRTVGDVKPWPEWVRSETALVQVGRWLRSYHDVVANYVPAPDAHWRSPHYDWRPGDVIGHNDAAPYNAVWRVAEDGSEAEGLSPAGQLVGFVDWDFAAPCSPIWDLAYTAFSWVPLHARDIAKGDGFTRFAERPARLRKLLEAYEFTGAIADLLDVVDARVAAHAEGVRESAARGDPHCALLIADGLLDALARARQQLAEDRASLISHGST